MTLELRLRALRASITLACVAAVAAGPAVADAAAKSKPKAHQRTAAAKKQRAARQVPKESNAAPAPAGTIGIGASAQLRAMTVAIDAAPEYFAGRETGCARVTPLLGSEPGTLLGGNFRDGDGGCYVWVNLSNSAMLTGSEVCKVTLHEIGHLTGLQHSKDPDDLMFSPFSATAIPAPCAAPEGAGDSQGGRGGAGAGQGSSPDAGSRAKAGKGKAKASVAGGRARLVCPPGATSADYCQATAARKAAARPRQRRGGQQRHR
jgi:hypothetical protein